MTILELLNKIKKYWYIIAILPIVTSFFGFTPLVDKISYKASITVGVALNSPDLTKVSTQNYDRQLGSLSDFLANRFKSLDIQKIIAFELGMPDSGIDSKKPFYEISNQSSGFINITGTFKNQSESLAFLGAIKKVYYNIIELEKNQNESSPYKIKPMDKFSEAIVSVNTPIQTKALPAVIGLLVAILVIVIIPDKQRIAPTQIDSQDLQD
jgi:capsular polysaccharide biosynthesis protein